MKRGYVRPSGWLTRAEQWDALVAFEVPDDAIYVEGEIGTLADAVKSLRPGDEFCVYDLNVIAGERIALEKWMRKIREEHRTVIIEVLKNRRSDNIEHVADMIFDALRRRGHKSEDAQRYGKMAKKRKVRAKVSRERAIALWRDPSLTRQEAARKIGMSAATCFRRYGKRGVPDGRPRKAT